MRTILLPLALSLSVACDPKDTLISSGGPGPANYDPLNDDQTDADADGYTADVDCDDEDSSVNPDAAELCDGIDNNCDGKVDNNATDATDWYPDQDEDGYGAAQDKPTRSCEAISGSVSNSDDCDDDSADVNPDGLEVCDGIDNDCDDLIDSTDPDVDLKTATTWYIDNDSDGYGGKDNILACSPPSGYVSESGDCNDQDKNTNPGVVEVCDEIDNDCNDLVDDDASNALVFYADSDQDTFGDPNTTVRQCKAPSGYVTDGSDCDDSNRDINIDAVEVCDKVDNDCDTLIDDDDADLSTKTTPIWYSDGDGDGFGDLDDAKQACEPPTGYIEDNTDCDDENGNINSDAQEICNGEDDDCDTLTDDADDDVDLSIGGLPYYMDYDSDGYGNPDEMVTACAQPSGYVTDDSDCDDIDKSINTDGNEVCDGVDNDCDGLTDDYDSDVADADTFYRDFDGDGYGANEYSIEACERPSRYVTDNSDCDDSDGEIYPTADEICDEIDNDCDDLIDDDDSVEESGAKTFYRDSDSDGYGDSTDMVLGCEQPSGYVTNSEDCEDSQAAVNPDGVEICDSYDNDCNGETNDGTGATGAEGQCPAYSCLSIIDLNEDAEDGNYFIDPNDNEDVTEVFCDMTTDGGGYTFLKVDYGSSADAETAETYCADLGMQLFAPRTEDHQLASLSYAKDSSIDEDYDTYIFVYHMYLLGIYPKTSGNSCAYTAFNSDSCTGWEATDGGPYWVGTNTSLSEPSGDNCTTCSMFYQWRTSDDLIDYYNDDNTSSGYSSSYFMCDVGDKWGDGIERGD